MTLMTPPPLDQQDGERIPHSEIADGAKPMEVAPVEAAVVAESQVEDPPTTSRFTWTIEHFSMLPPKKHYSEAFMVGGYKWRVLIFPKGNNVDHLSMYLDVAESATLPHGWSRYAQFSLSVINQLHNKLTIRKETQHQFNAREGDWGFTSFMPLSDLCDPSRGYIVNDTCLVEAEVAVGKIRLKKEQEEKEHKEEEKAEAHPYTIIKVARDDDLREQIGRDVYFELVDHEKVQSFRIQKQLPFHMFKEEVAKEFGIPVQFQRFWLWVRRQNHTYRPHSPLTPQEEAKSVGQLREITNKLHNDELKLFLEVELGQDLCPLLPPDKTEEDILLFFKLYDPEKEEFRYVGRLFVKLWGKPSDILFKLNEMAGFRPDEEIKLFEEIKYEPRVMCERIDKNLTFRSSQLEDGDIIWYQKSPAPDSEKQYRYPDVPSFLEYIRNRQDKVTAEGDASIIQHEVPTDEGESTSIENQSTSIENQMSVREAPPPDVSVEVTVAVVQASAQGDDGERSAEPSTTTPVLQDEQGSATLLASSAQPPVSLGGVSTSQSIKSKLPRRLEDLSIEQIQDVVSEVDATGQADLSDQLIPLYALVEDLHSSRREVSSTALAELQKAREADTQYKTEQDEIDKSLVAGELKVTELESVLTQAKGEVIELKRRRSALIPLDPQVIKKLRREVLKQEALDRISRAKIAMLDAEYEKLLLDLECLPN